MKKILAILMAAALMTTALAGCKSDEEIAQELKAEIQGFWKADDGNILEINGEKFELYISASWDDPENKEILSKTGWISFEGETMNIDKEGVWEDDAYIVNIEGDLMSLSSEEEKWTEVDLNGEWTRLSEEDAYTLFEEHTGKAFAGSLNNPKTGSDREIKTTVPPKSELPDELYFMTNLDPVKNSDGTYSFKGFFTGCKFSQYSKDPTLYIRTLNGKEFSTGETSMYYALYQNPRTGEYDSVLNGLMNNPSSITGILFEFVYDSNGNFVGLRQ